MRAIELAHNRNWTNLWLESDSSLVVQAFSAASLVPWEEGNQCADKLANIGLGLDSFTFWNELPPQISSSFVDNRLGKPSFRFVYM
ncbi:hypothetical protein TSUD_423530 [Trifolium subterraneum]|uniref:RNase H type-1 domain-containing protein n=1 Tax=Trifolium subterraneum TaxID=3900 RepID=A0A1B5Z8N8_TRISU|nr:hypothetical protein TSUD_423530 [Trifolium subterraneum]